MLPNIMQQLIFGGLFMSDKKKLIRSVVIGSLCGLLSCVALICVIAAVMLSTGLLSAELIDYLMIAVSAAGALIGAFVATKLNGSAGLIVGAITGAVMLLRITIGALVRQSAPVTALSAVRAAALLLGGALGGILGLRDRKHVGF